MTVHEYGKTHEKTLLFFPGSCTPAEFYTPAAEQLAGKYHVLLVTPDGHDPREHTDFISVEKTVDDTAAWLRVHNISRLDALYGLSFGGGMALRLLTTQNIPVGRAIIDAGTAPYQYPLWLCKLICVRDFLMTKLCFASITVMSAAFPPERFAADPGNWKAEYRELRKYLRTFSNRTIWNIFWSANNYKVPENAPPLDMRIQFWVGTEEWGSRYRDLKWVQQYLAQMETVQIPDMMHGELVTMHPEMFVKRAFDFLREDKL